MESKTIINPYNNLPVPEGVRPDILNEEDIIRIAPVMRKHPKILHALMRWLIIDRCNRVHGTYCYTTGAEFSHLLIDKAYRIRKHVYNEEVLDRFKGQPFITVSNHPMGGLDGILLIDILSRHDPEFKVMVNMILYNITAMRPSFIPVDPQSSDDPEKKKITMQGIRSAIRQVREGHPVGFFPAGAVSKFNNRLRITDREWQPALIRLIKQLNLPVIPVYFHERNSIFSNILGLIDWRIRTMQLPRELFSKTGKDMHITFGEPISVERQAACKDIDELSAMLRESTYALKNTLRK